MKGAYQNISSIIKALKKETDLETDRDWSEELLIYLALAYHAFKQLEKTEPLNHQGRAIVKPSLDRAWREALFVRLHLSTKPSEHNSKRKFTLTRFGNIEKR